MNIYKFICLQKKNLFCRLVVSFYEITFLWILSNIRDCLVFCRCLRNWTESFTRLGQPTCGAPKTRCCFGLNSLIVYAWEVFTRLVHQICRALKKSICSRLFPWRALKTGRCSKLDHICCLVCWHNAIIHTHH